MFNGLFWDEEGENISPFNLFTQEQALNAVAPRQAPEGLEFAMPEPAKSPQLGPGTQQMPTALPAARGLESPHTMAGLGQAVNNIMRMRRGGMPGASPIAAYQASVIRQAQEKRAQDTHDRKMDPFWEFEEAKRRGHIPQDMQYPEYLRLGYKINSDPAAIQYWNRRQELKDAIENAETEEERKAAEAELGVFDNYVRAGQVVDVGGGGKVRVGAGGRMDEIVSPETATGRDVEREGQMTRTEKIESGIAQQDADFRVAAQTIPELESVIDDTRQLMADIQSGKFQKTGFFEGRFTKFSDAETAKLAAKQVMQTLKNLQITNLAPVSNFEIGMVSDLYASVLKDPEANIGALQAALEMMEGKLRRHNALEDYWMSNNGTLRDFGINERYQKRTTEKDDIDI